MIEKNYIRAKNCLEDVKIYLLRLSETKVLSEEEKAERDFTLDELINAEKTFRDCRNELCSRCGRYEKAHEGACDKCRWR